MWKLQKCNAPFQLYGILVNEESGFIKDSSTNTDTEELLWKTLGSHKDDY